MSSSIASNRATCSKNIGIYFSVLDTMLLLILRQIHPQGSEVLDANAVLPYMYVAVKMVDLNSQLYMVLSSEPAMSADPVTSDNL